MPPNSGQVRRDDLFEGHEPLAIGHDTTGQHLGHLDPGEPALPLGRPHSTTKLSERSEMNGNGWPGSTAKGVSTG